MLKFPIVPVLACNVTVPPMHHCALLMLHCYPVSFRFRGFSGKRIRLGSDHTHLENRVPGSSDSGLGGIVHSDEA